MDTGLEKKEVHGKQEGRIKKIQLITPKYFVKKNQ